MFRESNKTYFGCARCYALFGQAENETDAQSDRVELYVLLGVLRHNGRVQYVCRALRTVVDACENNRGKNKKQCRLVM